MRLLIYGGTGYAERVRFGDCPPVPLAALQDFYGLNSDVPAYGAGLVGGSPFLIVREWHNRHERGGCPFSLLLDPGPEFWRHWRWNAAAIIASFFDGNPPLIDLLRREPEQVTEDRLEDLLHQLCAETASAGLPHGEVLATWLGAVLGRATCVLTPDAFGFKGRPTPRHLASLLQHLPAGLRLGQGWLVGGGLAHSKAYGANLIVDDEGVATSEPDAARDVGRRVYRLFAALDNGDVVSPSLAALAEEPINQWGPPVSEAISRLSLLAGVFENEMPDQVAGLLTEQRPTSAFETSLRKVAWEMITGGSEPLSPKNTALTIRISIATSATLPNGLLARFDTEAAIEELLRLKIPPRKLPQDLGLSPETVCRLGCAFFERQEGDSATRLGEILAALGPCLDRAGVATLAEVALARSVAEQEPLAGWLVRVTDDRLITEVVAPRLQSEAQRRAETRAPSWPHDYIAFAGDLGGAKLCDLLGPEDIPTLVGALHNAPRELEQATREWIEALAKSPLRARLPVNGKVTLAALAVSRNQSTAWKSLHVLFRLSEGERVIPPRSTATERRFLRDEFVGLVAGGLPEAAASNLQDIDRLLDGIPTSGRQHLKEHLKKFPPRLLDRDQAARYIDGLSHVAPEFYERERQRLIQESAEQLMDTLRERSVRESAEVVGQMLLQTREQEERVELVTLLLRTAPAEETEHHRIVLVHLLRAARTLPSLGQELRQHFATLPADQVMMAADKYNNETRVLEVLLRDANPATARRLVAYLFEQGGEAFRRLAVDLMGPYQYSGRTYRSPCPHLVNAITQYLVETGGALRDEIATKAWGVAGLVKFDALARGILEATAKTQ